MLSAIFFSDVHLESGGHLGHPDADVGNTRIADAQRVLEQIAAEECDVLIFGGDAGRTARLGPTSYRVLQEAFSASKAKYKVLLTGNHDYTGETNTSLHVIAASVPRTVLLDRPKLVKAGGLQIGGLPWVPPNRLFDIAPHSPKDMNRQMTDRLLTFARGLGAKLDPDVPSVLVAHWLVSSSTMHSGTSVVEASEPVIPTGELLGCGPWGAAVFGHNHLAQEVADTPMKIWVVGSPMRTSFGEEGTDTGYLRLTWHNGNVPDIEYVHTQDRVLLTLDVDVDEYLTTGAVPSGVAGAVVRVRYECSEEQARMMAAGPARELVEGLYAAGASKVVGPEVDVQRVERKRRDALAVDLPPMDALARWLDVREVPKERQRLAIQLARERVQ